MSGTVLKAVPITPDLFAPFGDVIFDNDEQKSSMNDARFERFTKLANVDIDPAASGRPSISIARCRSATSLPYRVEVLERHPKGSQAFMPLSPFCFVVVVAPAADTFDAGDLRAFVTSGRQGINYRKGVWHMPMIALQAGQEFLIVDRAADDSNCEELALSEPVTVDL